MTRVGYKVVFAALVLLAISCSDQKAKKGAEKKAESLIPQGDPSVPVRVTPISQQEFRKFGEYYGKVLPVETATLVAKVAGRVNELSANPGDQVKSQTQLCNIDFERLALIYRSSLLATRLAGDKSRRMQRHLQKGSGSQLQADQARLDYINAREAQLRAKLNRDGAACYSPIDGTVTERLVELHEEVNAGTPILKVSRLDEVFVDVGVPENEIGNYQKGAIVLVSDQAMENKKWPGKVEFISLAARSEDRKFRLRIRIKNENGQLRPGQTVKASVLQFEEKSGVVIPEQSILHQGKRAFVMLAENGVAKERDVIVRATVGEMALVSTGVKTGELLILEGHHLVSNGGPIHTLDSTEKK